MHARNTYTKNFIRKIIEEDLENNQYTTINTRFPPEPNGYLHIGHAKAICLNFGIAQLYQGTCNLRFDDTNPSQENIIFVDAIKNDVQWLGFQWNGEIRYSSDYFPKIFNYAIELINKGLAYVDELSTEKIREFRGTLTVPGKNSPYRNRSIKDNLLLFKKMRDGHFKSGEVSLRAKINMSSNYMIMRDPVLYRIKFAKHHQTGNQWCIYPMYDFAHCIADAIEGITHSLCTLEFQDNRRLYEWILNNITINNRPKQYEFSRLNLEYALTSKRKLTILVKNNIVEGWDDPRMLTIAGLRRRGYTPKSIREFCRRIGVTRQDNLVKMELLESCLRDDLNEYAPRAMAVLNPIMIILENIPKNYNKIIYMPNHPNKPQMGKRAVLFSRQLWIDRADFRTEDNDKDYKRLILGQETRLRYAYVIKANRIEVDKQGNITCIYCTCDIDSLGGANTNNNRKVKGVIHWLSVMHAYPAEFRLYDRLFNTPNPALLDDPMQAINLNSLEIKQGFIEPMLYNAEPMSSYQFEREGYFCVDINSSKDTKKIFNRTISLRHSFKNKKI